jgi:Tfp pilus assembly protein PilF
MRLLPALPLLAGLATPVQAQDAPAVTAAALPTVPLPNAAVPNPAVSLLVRQGQRWLDQGRPELAASSVERALAAEPGNADALVLAARVAVSRGNSATAAAYAARLRAAGGTLAQQAAMDAELRSATIDRAAVEDARRLAREGRSEDAAARYRAAFGPGDPPPAYAREYYQALAATRTGREAGQGGLAQLAAAPNADERTLLANAEALTFSPSTRADGLRRLAELAARPGAAPDVQQAWKQALGFYRDDPVALPQLEAFLRRYPDDTDIKRRLEALRAMPAVAPVGPGDDQRRRGFAELDAGALRPSAERFEAALAANPGDADALGGLGVVRLRQNRAAEAQTLLERAVAADPARGGQWRRALDGASYTLELAEARFLLRRGDAAGAETVLRRAAKRDVEDATDAESLLGEAALHRGDPAEAERHFRAALARRPGFAPAGTGLNQALRAQGRSAEVPEPRPRVADGSAPVSTEAARLRAEASRAADPATEAALLQNAVALAPNDPWVRLDLARALRRQGRDAEGRALVEELAARSPSADSAYAAALLAQEGGRPADAETFLARIPPQRRTADMARLGMRVRTQAEVARAAALLPVAPADGRQRLLALAGRPDPSGGTAADVIRALGDTGDQAGAADAARVAAVTNRTNSARLAIAGALFSVGQDAEGVAMASQIDAASLTSAQRQEMSALQTGAAVRASDRLNEAGDQAAAFERLRPALAGGADPNAELALARLYQGARRPEEAVRISEAVLARDPRNWDARRSAIDAAIAAGDRRRAEALAAESRAMAPADSRATLLAARVARAFGNNARAQTLLEVAAVQRREELGGSAPAARISTRGSANPFQVASASGALVDATAPGDRVSREIAQESALVRNESAPRALGSASVRVRSGTAGLDRLQDLSATAQASFEPGKLGGRVTTRVTPVFLDAGKLPTTGDAPLRFGSNAARGLAASSSSTATGAALNVGYQRGDLVSVDVGTSPLGFPVTNLLGGVEIAPKLTDTVRLRIRGERRSVLDSLLSYAGAKDGASGQTWGGVTQTGGHVQLEAGLGAGTAYASGGYAAYDGQHVAHNAKVEAGAGFSYPIYKDRDGEVRTGLDLIYFSFDNNQRGFTLGQGGYFSPRNFVAFNIPLDYRGKLGDLRYRLGATAGYASFREDASPLFPSDPVLQAQAETAARANPLVPTRNQAQTRNGFVGGVRVDLDYPLSDALTLGGEVRSDRAANWNETRATVRLENRF